MARKQTDKIDTVKSAEGLHNPFGDLHLDGLPEGPADVPQMEPVQKTETVPAKRGRVVLRREKAHRNGKTVVVVGDIPPGVSGAEIEELSRQLRKACGCGGTVRGREIEVQGDQPGRICRLLEEAGFRVAGVRE